MLNTKLGLYHSILKKEKGKERQNKTTANQPNEKAIKYTDTPHAHNMSLPWTTMYKQLCETALYPLRIFLSIIANKSGISGSIFLSNHIKLDRDLGRLSGLAEQPVFSVILALPSDEADSLTLSH